MVSIRIPAGTRGIYLASLIVHYNPNSDWEEADATAIEIKGPRLVIRRWMVEQALWPESTTQPASVDRFMRHFIRVDPKAVQESTEEQIVVAEQPEAEQAFLVRFPAALKARLADLAQLLGMSQNELVVRAVEDLISFGEGIDGDTVHGLEQ